MGEKNAAKISLSTVLLILAIFVIIIMGAFAYKLYKDNAKEVQKSEELQAQVNTLQEKVIKLSENENKLVSKIDNTKDWVYDAEYTKNVTADSYTAAGGSTFYAKDIVVPYININSSYAGKANTEIKKVFNSAISTYNEGVSNKLDYVDECNYKKYNSNNNISVVLTFGVGATDVVHPQYYTYNINLKTGNELTYEEVYKIAGFSSNNIESKVETAITKFMKEKLNFEPDKNNFDTYNNETIANYKKSINDNTLKYFLDNNGKLNIIVTISIPAGIRHWDEIIPVD